MVVFSLKELNPLNVSALKLVCSYARLDVAIPPISSFYLKSFTPLRLSPTVVMTMKVCVLVLSTTFSSFVRSRIPHWTISVVQ